MADARETLMHTAERLFAGEGIAAVSLRTINRESGQMNHSAVHYHFGDKMGLLQALCDERAPLLLHLRKTHIAEAMKVGPDSMSPERMMVAVLHSLIDFVEQTGGFFIGVRHQMMLSPDEHVRRLILDSDEYASYGRLQARLKEKLVGITPAEIDRRLHRCALYHGAVVAELVATEPDSKKLSHKFHRLIPELVPELVAMIEAPPPLRT